MQLILLQDYCIEDYPKYVNYDAIDIGKFNDKGEWKADVNSIPAFYDGIMGVPISFLDKYNPDQFEIIGLGISTSGLEIGVSPYKPEHKKYRREVQGKGAADGDLYMLDKYGHPLVPYARILIRRK